MQAIETPAPAIRVAGASLMAHAVIRAKQRRISEDDIRQTLLFPDRTYPGRANKWVSIKVISGRRIKAVWVMENGQQVVITVGDRDLDDQGRPVWKD